MGRPRPHVCCLCAALVLSCALRLASCTGFGVVGNLAFFALSDWGGQSSAPYTTPGQLAAATSLGRLADEVRPKLVLSAGGNFLDQGLPGAMAGPGDEQRMAATFQNVYTADGLQVPWFVTGGPPDWEGNITAEMAFNGTEATGGRWVYPNLWHTFTYTIPPFEETVQFVMVDTETLTSEQNQFPGWANVPDLYYPPPPANFGRRRRALGAAGGQGLGQGAGLGMGEGPRRQLHDFDVHNAPPISEAQWLWLEHTLGNSTADWLIVVGNDPVWSVGEHGPTWTLVERMLPLMEQAGVALYISGRDPIAQHLSPVPATGAVDFVGIGNGAVSNASQAATVPSLLLCPYGALSWVFGQTTGFLQAAVSSPSGSTLTALTVTFYDESGAVLYNFTKGNPRAAKGFQVTSYNGRHTLTVLGVMFLTAAGLLCGMAGYGYVYNAATRRAAFAMRAGPGARRAGENTPLVVKPTSNMRAKAGNVLASL